MCGVSAAVVNDLEDDEGTSGRIAGELIARPTDERRLDWQWAPAYNCEPDMHAAAVI
jgi:hypothetical protein